MADMPTARTDFGLTSLYGILYAIGGYDKNVNLLNTVDEFDPSLNQWQTMASMPYGKADFGVYHGSSILTFGGFNGNCLSGVEEFEVINNRCGSTFLEEKSITDRNGNKYIYLRDYMGNIIKQTNPDGSIKSYAYDDKSNLTMECDETGKYTFYIYDSNKINLIKKAQPLNGTDQYTTGCDESKFAVTTYTYYTDAEAQSLGYLVKGLLKSATHPVGNIATYTYYPDGSVKTITDTAGNTTTNNYNSIGWKTSSISPKGYRTDYYYDYGGRVEKTVINNPDNPAKNSVLRTTYDAMGRKAKEVSPNLYNPSYDNLAGHTYSGDQGTRYTYNASGTVNTVTDPANFITTYTYDIYGNVKTETKPNGSIYQYDYDVMNRLIKVWFKDNATATAIPLSEYTYVTNSDGTWQKTEKKYFSSTQSATTIYKYDYAGRLIEQDNPDSTVLKTAYNTNGRVYSKTDAKNNVSSYTYDGLNRLLQEKTPFENVSGTVYYSVKTYSYDKNGNVTLESLTVNKPGDAESDSQTGYEYNNRGLLTKVATYNNGAPVNYTQYWYDADGNKVRMYTGLNSPLTINGLDNVTPGSDAQYSVTKYDYNHLGKLKSMTDPLAKSETYSYDLDGNMTQKTDRNGSTITNTYDNLDRLTDTKVETTSGTGNVENTFTYNALGGRSTMVSGGVTTTYTYDQKGRLITESNTSGSEKDYTYNYADKRLTFVLKQSGNTIQNLSYSYDLMGRLSQALDNGQVTATYTYDLNGNRQSLVYSNGDSAAYTYNLANKLKTLTNAKGSTILSQYNYTYYLDGNQASKIDNLNNSTDYAYDGLDRLTSETVKQNGNFVTANAYTYDDYNNRQSMVVTGTGAATVTYTYDLDNRLQAEVNSLTGTISYNYDNNGNQLAKGSQTYIYDGFNQLVGAVNGAQTMTYGYNGDGLRTGKTVNGAATSFVWDGSDVAAELNGATVAATYVRGINLIDKKGSTGTVVYNYLFNGHGDVVQLSGSDGNVARVMTMMLLVMRRI